MGEDLTNVYQEQAAGVLSGRLVGETAESFEEAVGPMAADDLGDGEDGTPVVGETIDAPWRQDRVAGGDGSVVVLDPTGDLASEGGFDFGVAAVEAGPEGARRRFGQANDDGAVGQCLRELANAGNGGGGVGFEIADVGTLATHGAPVQVVSGVDEAAEVGILVGVGIEFVQAKSWFVLMDDAVEHRGLDVVGAQDVGTEAGDEIERRGFAATGLGGGDVEAG